MFHKMNQKGLNNRARINPTTVRLSTSCISSSLYFSFFLLPSSSFGGRGFWSCSLRGRFDAVVLLVHRRRLPPRYFRQKFRTFRTTTTTASPLSALLLLPASVQPKTDLTFRPTCEAAKIEGRLCYCCQSMHSHVLRKSPIIGLLLEAGIATPQPFCTFTIEVQSDFFFF